MITKPGVQNGNRGLASAWAPFCVKVMQEINTRNLYVDPVERPPVLPQAEGLVRRLIHIPIIHNEADMGALGKAVRDITIQKLGLEGWERNLSLIDGLWSQIEQAIDRWALPYEKVRLYQDGLPVCGRELEIVTELARAGSRNHQLLLRLTERGAAIMGTESAELLVEEYKFIKRALAAGLPAAQQAGNAPVAASLLAQEKSLSQSLLRQRDQAIAWRINQTLRPGEIGLLFLGMLHSLAEWLAKDIEVTHPIYPPLPVQEKRP